MSENTSNRRRFQRIPDDFIVDIIIPVYNEEGCVAKSVRAVHGFLSRTASYGFRIVVADNASTDATPQIVTEVAQELKTVSLLRLEQKGRGRALRRAFVETDAHIVSYMDVDLSTNLRYFPLMVEGIRCGYDVCIGSRLMQAARTTRSPKREFISRTYNTIIKLTMGNRFSDAQCGFKMLRTDVARLLVPMIANNNWFFDTELLLLAEHNSFRIFEVPVEWIEDEVTSVHLLDTILEDLMGLARVRMTRHRHRLRSRDK